MYELNKCFFMNKYGDLECDYSDGNGKNWGETILTYRQINKLSADEITSLKLMASFENQTAAVFKDIENIIKKVK